MTDRTQAILLLGYGEMGHAMEYLLGASHAVSVWDPYFKGYLKKIDLDEAVQEAEIIIFCTPTAPIYELAQRISPSLQQQCLCLSMAKALDDEGRTAPQALQQGLAGQHAYGVLYGPMISEEIRAGRPAFASLAASDANALERALVLFRDTSLKLTPFNDVRGAAWCAVLKNIYAMLFGMADELALGDNVRGFLAVATLEEMAGIVQSVGGSAKTPYSLAGLGDLVTTATSEHSHHHELGRMVARNERDNLVGEGMSTLAILARRRIVHIEDYPFLHCVWRIMYESADPGTVIDVCIRAVRSTPSASH